MSLPIRIDPCPILESVVEVRFSSDELSEAIFGLFQREVKSDFPKPERLQILELPEAIRNREPSLEFKPHFRFRNEKYDINLGPKVISIIGKEQYPGWEEYSVFVLDILSKLNKIEIVKDVTRLGLRYVNFFESNIFSDTDISLKLANNNWISENTFIKNVFVKENHRVILQLSNSSRLKRGVDTINGSLLDIDVINDNVGKDFMENPREYLNETHRLEKEMFYEILKDDFISTLNPVYKSYE